MAKIITVYRDRAFELFDMSGIRWQAMSEALARAGHEVTMAVPDPTPGKPVPAWLQSNPLVHQVPLREVRWREYDVVKTTFHLGFRTLDTYGGTSHPFIISHLGSVVGSKDLPGIYFYGSRRRELYAIQQQIARTSRYVSLLTLPARDLWASLFGGSESLLIVPGVSERVVPPPTHDPYPDPHTVRCLFAGNVYDAYSQRQANQVLIAKLNELGKHLDARGIRLYFLGIGDVSRLKNKYVTYLGSATYADSWNYLYTANVGIVVLSGKFQHNNESTKIYYYLRVGLPVVSESGFPNDNVVRESGLGYVAPNGDLGEMAQLVQRVVAQDWPRDAAIEYILAHHTWDVRAAAYARLIHEQGLQVQPR